jgi:hypothetical protein
VIKNSPGFRRDLRVKMLGTSSPTAKLTGDLGNVIEATQTGVRRSDRLVAGKLSPGNFRLLQQYRHIAAQSQCGSMSAAWRKRTSRRRRYVGREWTGRLHGSVTLTSASLTLADELHASLDIRYSCQTGAEHSQQCAKFPLLRYCGLEDQPAPTPPPWNLSSGPRFSWRYR